MAQQTERVKLLRALIQGQIPKPEYVAAGRAAAQAILLSLQQRKELSVAEFRFAGSIAKGTSLNGSDFDLVVFLNDEKPPFSPAVIDAFHKAVQQARVPGGVIHFRGKNNMLVKASAHIGSFDLELDVNIAPVLVSGVNSGQTQVTRVAVGMQERGIVSVREISPVFTEATIQFFRDVTPQMLDAIRVAKYWNSKVNLYDAKIHGGSFIIELVTLEANRISEGTDLEDRFVKFLQAMENLAQQKIILTKEYNEQDIPARVLS
ncbi:uncharacterized protein LOC118439361 [Folsomia candida]|uniref:Polymerase nucleotidyl transferase domain-containing protein n=1 Tax=Folsomia candida TaxID=158441 RepID=A0A226D5Q8_FOLCA|nr:uncharacterized protein LOC118439361 [Folsomia candida]OXA40214.1 hypothetical protein Fcan01_24877 [Folsomia candida]